MVKTGTQTTNRDREQRQTNNRRDADKQIKTGTSHPGKQIEAGLQANEQDRDTGKQTEAGT